MSFVKRFVAALALLSGAMAGACWLFLGGFVLVIWSNNAWWAIPAWLTPILFVLAVAIAKEHEPEGSEESEERGIRHRCSIADAFIASDTLAAPAPPAPSARVSARALDLEQALSDALGDLIRWRAAMPLCCCGQPATKRRDDADCHLCDHCAGLYPTSDGRLYDDLPWAPLLRRQEKAR